MKKHKPTYFNIFTLDEKRDVKTYRIPNSAIKIFEMKLESVEYGFNVELDEEIKKVYTNNFTLVTKKTEETRVACNALDRKETLFFVTIDYDDGTSVSVFDNEDGFEQWRKNETDEGITFFLYCRKR